MREIRVGLHQGLQVGHGRVMIPALGGDEGQVKPSIGQLRIDAERPLEQGFCRRVLVFQMGLAAPRGGHEDGDGTGCGQTQRHAKSGKQRKGGACRTYNGATIVPGGHASDRTRPATVAGREFIQGGEDQSRRHRRYADRHDYQRTLGTEEAQGGRSEPDTVVQHGFERPGDLCREAQPRQLRPGHEQKAAHQERVERH